MITYLAADAPPPTWAGIITAFASLVIAVGGGITAVSLALARHRASKRLDAYQRDTTHRLDVIHTLVNSTLTAAKEAELAATRRELAMALRLADAGERSENDQADIGALRQRIDALSEEMADRAAQTRAANLQIAAEADRKIELGPA